MSKDKQVLISENCGGNVHSAVSLINKLGLADYVISIHSSTGHNSIIIYRVPESMVEDGKVVPGCNETQIISQLKERVDELEEELDATRELLEDRD